MGTIPDRISILELSINSIIKQVDRLYISLNDWNKNEIPIFIRNNKKIKYTICNNSGINVCERWLFCKNFKSFDLIFCIDDDILYPPDYVEKMTSKLAVYNNKAFITVHGYSYIDFPINDFIKDKKDFCHFKSEVKISKKVSVPGVGTMLSPASLIDIDKISFIPYNNDLCMSKYARDMNIPIICIEREANWLSPISQNIGNKVFKLKEKNRDKQTKIINEVLWNGQ
jgi:hypothetical protein